ncbi:MAG: hypothetical protein EP344_05005 [Bacteroidetes bacterium]|nr:MAG: hypothetical protein EP344_05005 [Bacteroidota bacterium]
MEKYKSYLINAACLGVGIAFGLLYSMQAGGVVERFKFGIDFGDNKKVDLELNSASIDHVKILERMFSQPFSVAGTQSWLKQNRDIYDLHDVDLYRKLRGLKYEDEVCENIRKLFDDKAGPFAYQLDSVAIGFPGGIPEGVAYVPNHSKYRGKRVEITSRQYNTQIVVNCIPNYPCTGALGRCPDMQISHKDAFKLFPVPALPKTQDALAVIIP